MWVTKNHELDELNDKIKVVEGRVASIKLDIEAQSERRAEMEVHLGSALREIRRASNQINTHKKQIDQYKKEYKKEEHQIHVVNDAVREYEIQIEKLRKNFNDFVFETRRQNEIVRKGPKLL